MKLIIGLGNPGEKYKNNRHNVGHMLIDSISNKPIPNIQTFKTNTFMNNSGDFVKKQMDFYKVRPSDIYIVHDDLDIPLGQYKIQLGKGPELHYGIQSIESALGGKDFWRVRIGVDNRPTTPKASRAKGEDYVLQDFTKEEQKILENVYAKIRDDLTKS